MFYEKYESKIKKRLKLRQIIFKYKLVILFSLFTIILFTVFYNANKGKINGTINILNNNYGDNLEINGLDTKFSNIYYEFSFDNGLTWVEETPKNAGVYLVRGVSKKSFNRLNYTESYEFSINKSKTDLIINQADLVYGDNVDYSIELENDDYIKDIKFELSDYNSEKAYLLLNNIIIFNNENLDVTNNYNINFDRKELNILNKDIRISPKYFEKIYDGLDVIDSDLEIDGNVCYDDYISASFYIEETANKVGIYTSNIREANIINKNNEISKKYNVNLLSGQIKILKRDLTITTKSITKTYDGTPLQNNDFDAKNLADGDYIDIIESASITNYGNIINKITYKIYNEDHIDVTDCYNITEDFGNLSIEKLDLKVKTENATSIYNGNIQSDLNYILDKELIGNDYIEIIEYSEFIDSGAYENRLIINIFNTGIISENYNIIYEYGLYVIEKRELTITLEIITGTFDEAKTYQSNSFGYTENGLISGHVLTISSDSVKNQGTYELDIIATILSADGIDVTKNYNINSDKQIINILKKEVNISLVDNLTKVYDGEIFKYDEFNVICDYNLNIKADVVFNNTPINAGNYNYYLTNAEILNDEYNNYSLIYDETISYNLTILKRKLAISPIISDFTYNKEVINYDNTKYNLLEGSLINNDSININVIYLDENGLIVNPINAGIYYAKISEISFINGLKDNYDIEKLDTKFNILKRTIYIKPTPKTYIYGDKINYSTNDYEILSGEIIDDIRIIINFNYDVFNKNVGTYYLTVDNIEIHNNDYKEINNLNYEIISSDLEITINKYDLHINLLIDYLNLNNDQNHIYNNENIIYSDYYNNFEAKNIIPYYYLIKINVLFKKNNSIINPLFTGTYEVIFNDYESYDGLKNYNIIQDNILTFEIVKKDISVFINDDIYTYDGNNHVATYSGDRLYNNLTYDLDFTYNDQITSPKNAGQYDVIGTLNCNNEEILNNYNFIITNGTINILRVDLNIFLKDISKTYKGEIFDTLGDECYEVFGNIPDGESVVVLYELENSPKNVGSYNINYLDFEVLNGLTKNYNLLNNVDTKTFTITNKALTINFDNKDFIYGESIIFNSNEISIEGQLDGNVIVLYEASIDLFVGKHYVTITDIYFENDNENLINNYDINIINTEYNIVKRIINVEIEKYNSKKYDGIGYSYLPVVNNYNLDITTAYNEELIINVLFKGKNNSSINSCVNADNYRVLLSSFEIINGENFNYDIYLKEQSFEISKQDLTIKPIDVNYDYNGSKYIYDESVYQILDGELIGQDEFVIDVIYLIDGIIVDPINVGIYEIMISNIRFIQGNNLNYNIIKDNGQLIINESEIIIRLNDEFIHTGQYNGYSYGYIITENNFDLISYPESLKDTYLGLTINVYYLDENNNPVDSPINAGLYYVKFLSGEFLDSSLNVIKISCLNELSFRISEKEITFDLPDLYHTYDGLNALNSFNNIIPNIDGIVGNDYFRINVYTEEEAINCGAYDLYLYEIEFIKGLSTNYIVNGYNLGRLIIEKRDITLKIPDYSYSYRDDNTINTFRFDLTNSDLVLNDQIFASVNYELNGEIVDPIDVNTYICHITEYYFLNGLESNYNIVDVIDSTLTITKKQIDITTSLNNYSKEYDSSKMEFDNVNYTILEQKFSNLELIFDTPFEILNAGTYHFRFNVINVINENIDNFDFNVINKTQFIVNKREIIVSPYKDFSNVIYGNLVTYENFENNFIDINNKLLSNEQIILDVLFKKDNKYYQDAKNVGNYQLEISDFSVINGLNSNYTVTFDNYYDLEITPLEVNIELFNKEMVFDFVSFNYQPNDFGLDKALPYDEQFEISVYYKNQDNLELIPIYYGTYSINLRYVYLISNDDESTIMNYQINSNIAQLNILKKSLVFNINLSDDLEYSNEIKNNFELNCLTDSIYSDLVTSYGVSIKKDDYYVQYIKEIGVYEVTPVDILFEPEIMDSLMISTDPSFYEVVKRKITVDVMDEIVTYNGSIFTPTNYSLNKNLALGDNIYVNYEVIDDFGNIVELKNAGDYYFRAVSSNLDNNSNYEVTYNSNYSMFRINKKNVTIYAYNDNFIKIYDGHTFNYAEFNGNYSNQVGLLDGVMVTIKPYYEEKNNYVDEVKNVGSYDVIFRVTDIIGDLISNYNYSFNSITAVINKRVIELDYYKQFISSSYGNEYIFDYIPHNYVVLGEYDVADGEELSIKFLFVDSNNRSSDAARNVGQYHIKLGQSTKHTVKNGKISNYEIILNSNNEFEISKLQIVLKAQDKTHIFNGKGYNYDNTYEIINGNNFQYNESLNVKAVFFDSDYNEINPIYYGTYYIKLTDKYTLNKRLNPTATLSNYDIVIVDDYGVLEILKLEAEINIKSNYISEYNGLDKIFDYDIDSNNYSYIKNYVNVIFKYYLGENRIDRVINVGNYHITAELSLVDDLASDSLDIIVNDLDFEVTKRKVTIKPQDVVHVFDNSVYIYDGTKYISDKTIPEIDTLTINVTYNEENPKFVGKYIIDIFSTSLDDNLNYEIIKAQGNLQIIKRDIIISLLDNYESKIYDGVYSYNDLPEFIVTEGILYNDIESIKIGYMKNGIIYDTAIDEGYYLVKISEVIMENLDNYNILLDSDIYFTIYKKDIIVSTNDLTFIYDSNTHFDDTINYDDNDLVNNHHIKINYVKEFKYYCENEENVVEVNIFDDLVDVSNNYNIIYNYGLVNVLKRQINITSATMEFEFLDDYTLANSFVDENVAENDHVVIIKGFDGLFKGVYLNDLDYMILNDLDEDVTDSYIINKINGTITINSCTLKYEYDENVLKRYNGQIQSYDAISYFYPQDDKSIKFLNEYYIDLILQIKKDLEISELFNYGTYEILILGIEVSSDVRDSVNIILINENSLINYEILKAELIVNYSSEKKLYDGTPLSNLNCNISNLQTNDYAVLPENGPEITNVGKIDNIFDIRIFNGNKDVTDNYNIKKNKGELEIYNYVIMDLSDFKLQFNGNNQNNSFNNFDILNEQGVLIKITNVRFYKDDILADLINYGEYNYEIVDFDILINGRLISGNNYELSNYIGIIKINKAQITIQTGSRDFIYNGMENSYNSYTFKSDLDVSVELELNNSIKNQGFMLNEAKNINIFYDGINVTENFDITVNNGYLYVAQRDIYFETGSGEKIYDGSALINDYYSYIGGLIDGDTLITDGINTFQKAINCSVYSNIIKGYKIINSDGIDVTKNYYTNDMYFGTLTVLQKNLVITTDSAIKEFDNTPLTNNNISVEGLLENDYVDLSRLIFTGSQTIVGVSKNELDTDSVIIRNKDGKIVTYNYNIEYVFGNLEVY